MTELNKKQKAKVMKILKKISYCSLSTYSADQPHTTIVQPAVTPDWKILILSKIIRKKVSNIRQNNNVWLTFDAAGMFKIPKAVYIDGTAELESLTQDDFDEFLSYHGWVTKKILSKIASEGFDKSTKITFSPEKIITEGIFAKPDNPITFTF